MGVTVVCEGVQGSVRVCVQGGAYILARVCVCAYMWVRGSVRVTSADKWYCR